MVRSTPVVSPKIRCACGVRVWCVYLCARVVTVVPGPEPTDVHVGPTPLSPRTSLTHSCSSREPQIRRTCGARVWCACVVRVCGARVWCAYVVRVCGVRVWCACVVRVCGAHVWCACVVRVCGARMWCTCVVCVCGAHVWCACVVCVCGARVWCACVVRVCLITTRSTEWFGCGLIPSRKLNMLGMSYFTLYLQHG